MAYKPKVLDVADGGTSASTFTQSNGIVTYNGTNLVNYAGPQLSSSGVYTNSSQPAFYYKLSAQDNSSIGGNAYYTLGSGNVLTKVFDNDSNCSTAGVFTAPITGLYNLFAVFSLDLGSTTTQIQIAFINATTSTTYTVASLTMTAIESSFQVITASSFLPMAANDTMSVNLFANGAKNGDARATSTTFGGYLVC